MKKIAVASVALIAVLTPLVAGGLRAGCTAARLRAAGRFMLCRVKAYTLAYSRNESAASDLAECDSAFDERWQNAINGYGDCPALDEAEVLATAQSCVDTVVSLIIGQEKIIFASSTLMEPGYPNYVYPEGADARCQQLADATGTFSGRQFKAFICGASPDISPGTSLSIRQRFSSSPARYVDTLGNVIAQSLDDLLDGTIANTITTDEYGSPIVIGGGREYAWTGCQGNGEPKSAAYLCQQGSFSWTTGHVGTTGGKGLLTSTTGGTFFDAAIEACNAPLHLICVDQ